MAIGELSSLGLRLRHARKERGMSQVALAAAAGIKQGSLSELETGETKEISGPTLIAIAGALKVRPDWLVTGKGKMDDPLGTVEDDEVDLVLRFRKASGRWRIAIRYMVGLERDDQQEEAATYLLSKIFATPVSDKRVEEAYGFPPGKEAPIAAEPGPGRKGEHRFSTRDGAPRTPRQKRDQK